MSLPTRKIGNDDVTAIGFGLMGLSAFYGAIENDEERFKVGTHDMEIAESGPKMFCRSLTLQ